MYNLAMSYIMLCFTRIILCYCFAPHSVSFMLLLELYGHIFVIYLSVPFLLENCVSA